MRQAVAGQDAVREVRVIDVLEDSAAELADNYRDQPVVEAELRRIMAEGFLSLGMTDQVVTHRQFAYDLLRRHLGPTHRQTLEVMIEYASVADGSSDSEASVQLSREALELVRAHHAEDAKLLVLALNQLFSCHFYRNDFLEAAAVGTEAVQVSREALPATDQARLSATANLGYLLIEQGRPAEAEELCREVLSARQTLYGDDAIPTLRAKDNLTNALRELCQSDEAAELSREVLAGYSSIYGEESGIVDFIRDKLTVLCSDIGRLDEAELLARKSLEWRESRHGSDHVGTILARANLAQILLLTEEFEEAEPLVREILAWCDAKLEPSNGLSLLAQRIHGNLLVLQGNAAEAEPILWAAVRSASDAFGEQNRATVGAKILYARCLTDLGRYEEAEQELNDCRDTELCPHGRPPTVAEIEQAFVRLYEAWGKPVEADEWRHPAGAEDA